MAVDQDHQKKKLIEVVAFDHRRSNEKCPFQRVSELHKFHTNHSL